MTHASLLEIEPQAFQIAHTFFRVDSEMCWFSAYFDNHAAAVLSCESEPKKSHYCNNVHTVLKVFKVSG